MYRIGRFQPNSRDTNNNREILLLMHEQRKPMRDLLFSSTNMAAMKSRENLLSEGKIRSDFSIEFSHLNSFVVPFGSFAISRSI